MGKWCLQSVRYLSKLPCNFAKRPSFRKFSLPNSRETCKTPSWRSSTECLWLVLTCARKFKTWQRPITDVYSYVISLECFGSRPLSSYFKVKKKSKCSITAKKNCFLLSFLGKCRYRTTRGFCCVPFTYRRRRYNGCATNRRGQKWCAITPDFNRNKLWGYCRGGSKRKILSEI